jgi:putative addiction module CopG family antidote
MSTAIEISPESERFIQELIARGEYRDRAAVVDDALQLLKKQREDREQLIRDVNYGVEQALRGDYGPLDIDELKAKVAERFYARQKKEA